MRENEKGRKRLKERRRKDKRIRKKQKNWVVSSLAASRRRPLFLRFCLSLSLPGSIYKNKFVFGVETEREEKERGERERETVASKRTGAERFGVWAKHVCTAAEEGGPAKTGTQTARVGHHHQLSCSIGRVSCPVIDRAFFFFIFLLLLFFHLFIFRQGQTIIEFWFLVF